jgi:hypothetical protein
MIEPRNYRVTLPACAAPSMPCLHLTSTDRRPERIRAPTPSASVTERASPQQRKHRRSRRSLRCRRRGPDPAGRWTNTSTRRIPSARQAAPSKPPHLHRSAGCGRSPAAQWTSAYATISGPDIPSAVTSPHHQRGNGLELGLIISRPRECSPTSSYPIPSLPYTAR